LCQDKLTRIEPKTGFAFNLEKGQTLRITDIEGGQVADLFCAVRGGTKEVLSSGHTTDYNGKIFLSSGDILYSNYSNPMLTIDEDTVGGHIMLYAPCSQEMFERSYEFQGPHPNCFDNLANNLGPLGLDPSQITVPLNIFMNIEIMPDGSIKIKPPRSKAGDYLELMAEIDLIVGVTACAAGLCNNFDWTPIEVAIFSGE
jgi:uncharacterized protein YcgI (DUF1989 family)